MEELATMDLSKDRTLKKKKKIVYGNLVYFVAHRYFLLHRSRSAFVDIHSL